MQIGHTAGARGLCYGCARRVCTGLPLQYSLLGVQEYFQYDPSRDYLEPPLQGLCLMGQVYQPISATTSPEGTLRLYDPTTGQRLPSYQEAVQARREAEERARAAEARAAELEARLQALQAAFPSTLPPSADAQF